MADDLIRYDILVQDALREVIQKVLREVAVAGLPGEHHFFITFLTTAPGVKISSRLKKLYPKRMTIVIQHQFWDLIVTDSHFEINLSFNNVPEKLLVPFAAIQAFYDPQASFEAAFDLPELTAEKKDKPASMDEQAQNSIASITHGNSSTKKTNKAKQESTDNPNSNMQAQIVSLDEFRKNRD